VFSLTPQQVEETKHPKESVYQVDSAKYDSGTMRTNATAHKPVKSFECQQV
jgi:hypothetical protein